MTKNTKLLLGAGAALGLGYLLLRKDDGKVAGLGFSEDFIDSDKYWLTSSWKRDVKKAIVAFAQTQGAQLTSAELDAAFEWVNAEILKLHPLGRDKCRAEVGGRTPAETGACFDPILESWFLTYSASAGGGASEVCPAGTTATGQKADGSPICTATGSTGGTGGKDRTGGGGKERTGTGEGPIPGGDEKPPPKEPPAPPKKDDGGIGIGTIALALAAGGVVWFLLKTDDTKVVKLRAEGAEKARNVGARAAGAASRKLAEYQRRLNNGVGVNGLRRRRKSKR
jgi:hypothetical protein